MGRLIFYPFKYALGPAGYNLIVSFEDGRMRKRSGVLYERCSGPDGERLFLPLKFSLGKFGRRLRLASDAFPTS